MEILLEGRVVLTPRSARFAEGGAAPDEFGKAAHRALAASGLAPGQEFAAMVVIRIANGDAGRAREAIRDAGGLQRFTDLFYAAIPARAANALGFMPLEKIVRKSYRDLLRTRGIGRGMAAAVRDALEARHLRLGTPPDEAERILR